MSRDELLQALWLGSAGDGLVAQTLEAFRRGDRDRVEALWQAAPARDKALGAWVKGERYRANPREIQLTRRIGLSRMALDVLESLSGPLEEGLRMFPAMATRPFRDLVPFLQDAVSAAVRSGSLHPIHAALPEMWRAPLLQCRACSKIFLRARSKRAQRYCDGCRGKLSPKQRWTRRRGFSQERGTVNFAGRRGDPNGWTSIEGQSGQQKAHAHPSKPLDRRGA
jgi:hypothetical protein